MYFQVILDKVETEAKEQLKRKGSDIVGKEVPRRRNKSQNVNFNNQIHDKGNASPGTGVSTPDESSNESEDKIDTVESRVLSRLANLTFTNKKAKFMMQIFTSKNSEKKVITWIPDLDIIAVSKILDQPHYMKNLEALLSKAFSDMVLQGLAKDNPETAALIDGKFEEIYKRLSNGKASVDQILQELKNLVAVSNAATSGTLPLSSVSVSSPGDLFCKVSKSEPHVHIEKPPPIIVPKDLAVDIKELDSPASHFLPQGPVIQKVPFKV